MVPRADGVVEFYRTRETDETHFHPTDSGDEGGAGRASLRTEDAMAPPPPPEAAQTSSSDEAQDVQPPPASAPGREAAAEAFARGMSEATGKVGEAASRDTEPAPAAQGAAEDASTTAAIEGAVAALAAAAQAAQAAQATAVGAHENLPGDGNAPVAPEPAAAGGGARQATDGDSRQKPDS